MVLLGCFALRVVVGAESEPVAKPGLAALQLVSDQDGVVPGESVTVGLFLRHKAGYHTYWRAPGIVGVPTSIQWKLPPGFVPGPLEWPVPERIRMARHEAYGYERDVCLLTEIETPGEIEGDRLTIRARVSFMACARSCHPGWHDLELELPVVRKGEPERDRKWERFFTEQRREGPTEIPGSWERELAVEDGFLRLTLEADGRKFAGAEDVYFFCDRNLIHSDAPQEVERSRDGRRLSLVLRRSGFGPEDALTLSGLLYHDAGWPDLESKWLAISLPLPSDES